MNSLGEKSVKTRRKIRMGILNKLTFEEIGTAAVEFEMMNLEDQDILSKRSAG